MMAAAGPAANAVPVMIAGGLALSLARPHLDMTMVSGAAS